MNLRLPQSSISQGLGGVDREAEGIPSEEALIKRYCEKRGIPTMSDVDYYVAFSFFRLASICQGVYKRSISGNASSEKGKAAGMVADALAAMGVEALG